MERQQRHPGMEVVIWNYRVIRKPIGSGGYIYQIYECYYTEDQDPSGVPDTWTVDPIAPCGDTQQDLRLEALRMARATKTPILEEHNGKLREVK